ncbi:MAG TPA: RNase J family beta-CASP ribonuclease [Ruminococcaceae bacterium]|nr:RNase J family beta-CASP ribonuclease [Oscillospiraceae bacterium]
MNEKKEKNESIRSTAKTAQNKPKRTYNRKPKTENKAAANTQPKRNAQKPQAERKSVPQKQPQTGLKRRYSGRTPQKPLKIIPLGGLGEIGKNITLYEYDGDMMLVDCGMAFPDEEMPGIDIVIPDFTYVLENKDKIKGLVVTHGHEDHIGAIPYLLRNFNVPIYATRLTVGLIEGKLREHKLLNEAKLNVTNPGDTVRLGKFEIEFIHVNHSIPDAVGFAITCPAGTVVQTGDFKIDTTPIDDYVIDIGRFAELGKKGVLALMSDSTNAERPGFTPSERIVGDSFSNLFKKAENHRILVATFSSNIHRIQQIIDEACRCGRKVAVSGRSMINVVSVAAELGYLNVPKDVLIDIETIKNYPPEELVIVTTGSQGEPLSALHRIAFSDHRQVEIIPGDMIIISATPIPGNEKLVSKVVNELMKRGANVVYERMYDVHVSGHACQEELKLMMSIVKPKYFIPLHGEQKHLMKHAMLARQMGIPEENILIADNGNVIEVSRAALKSTETVQAGRVLVDGLGVGDVGSIVLRDRKHLADDGIIIIAVSIDGVTREVVSGPDVVSRGFVYVKESERLMHDIDELVCDILEGCYVDGIKDWSTIKTRIKDRTARFVSAKTRRSPMILPIIMEV